MYLLYKMAKFSKKKRSNNTQRGKRTRKLKGGTDGELQSLKQKLEKEEKKKNFFNKNSDKISSLKGEIYRLEKSMKKTEKDKKRKEEEEREKAEKIKEVIERRGHNRCVTDENKYIQGAVTHDDQWRRVGRCVPRGAS